MPVRDRLNEMHLIKSGGKTIQNGETAIDVNSEIEQTFQESEAIQDNINKIKNNTERVNDILQHNQLKLSKNLQDELDSTFNVTTTTAYKINNSLKSFQNDLEKLKNTNSAEYRIRKVQFSTLKHSFQDALKESSATLERHKNNRRELLKKSFKTVHKDTNEEELETLLDENKLHVFTDNLLITSEEARVQLAAIEERHHELLKIEKHLNEVLHLFINLATLVEQQQESIDRVEFHSTTATQAVEQGTVELGKGVKNKKKSFKKKVYILLIVIVVLMFIILIIVL